MTLKGPRPDAQHENPPMQVMLFAEPEQPPAPEVPVPKTEVAPPQLVVPVVSIELPAAPPTAITMVEATPPPAPRPAPAPESEADTTTPISIAQAEWMRMPNPVYPRAAAQARAQGVVHVRALVDVTGHAREARVHRSSGFAALDRAACDSVLAALFKPYLHNGVPRSVDVIVPVTFALKQRGGGRNKDRLELDVRGENHHAVGGHAEELGGLGAAALHVGE